MFVYYTLSMIFPDRQTFMDKAGVPVDHDKQVEDEESTSSWHEVGKDDKDGVVVMAEEVR